MPIRGMAPAAPIYAADTDQDKQAAVVLALADPGGALTCYRAIAAERGLSVSKPEVAKLVSTETAPARLAKKRRHHIIRCTDCLLMAGLIRHIASNATSFADHVATDHTARCYISATLARSVAKRFQVDGFLDG